MKNITIIVMITFLFIGNMISISTASIMTGVWTDSDPGINGFNGTFETKSLANGTFGIGDESLGRSDNPYWSFEGFIRTNTSIGDPTYIDDFDRYNPVTIIRTSGEFELKGDMLFGDPAGTLYTGMGISTYTGINHYIKDSGGTYVYDSTSGVSVMRGGFDDNPFSFILTSDVISESEKYQDGGFNYYSGFLNNAILEIEPIPEPATMLLFGIGLLGLTGIIRRKK